MVMRPRLHDRSSWRDPTLKDLPGRDENHSSLRGTNSFLWFKSHSHNNPGVTREALTGFVALR